MSRSYGIRKDFGFHSDGEMFLSGTQQRNVASSSNEMSSYRSTMPAYRQHTGGSGQHGRLNISSASGVNSNKTRAESSQSSASVSSPSDAIAGLEGRHKSSRGGEAKEKKPRTWFNRSKKSKRAPENVIVEVARASPMLHIRSLRSSEKDQFGRPQAEPEELKDEEVLMQLSYDAPEDITKTATDLVRLTLQTTKDTGANRTPETLQVTLRKRGQGFGLHLSTGLPPITVTYVEPGGDAEAAGVKVGDQIVEVNGEDCKDVQDITKIVALKSVIQQTDIKEDRDGTDEFGAKEGSNDGITDTTWNQIQAKWYQDEVDSHTSSNVELTQIDGDSDTPEVDVLEAFREKAGKHLQQEQMQISATQWERMKEQRDLLFDKNAPSAVIHEKSLQKEAESASQPVSDTKSPKHTTVKHLQSGDQRITSHTETKTTPEKIKSSSSGWFRKKKKEGYNEMSGSSINHPGTTEIAVADKQVEREETRKGHGHKKTWSGKTSGQTVADKKKSKGGGGLVMKITSIDDIDDDIRDSKPSDSGKKTADNENIKKTFSYEGPLLPPPNDSHVTTSLPRSKSHNAMFRTTLMQAMQQQQQQPLLSQQDSTQPVGKTLSPEAQVIAAHHRSKSYDVENDAEMASVGEGWGSLSQNEGPWQGATLTVESRKTSRSQTDISRLKTTSIGRVKVDIDPNIRLKKSGVIKHSWGQRPTLEVFGTSREKEKGNVLFESTDGQSILNELSTVGNDVKPLDLGAIPHTNPSLGRRPGHTRRDLVARSSVKRRPPSNRGSLLFKVDDSQKMGTKRVDLSEYSSTHHSRTYTMPEKMSRKVIETTPVTASLHLPIREEREDEITKAKSNGESRNIFKDFQQQGTGNNLQQPVMGVQERASSFNTQQHRTSTTSTGSSADMVAQAVTAKKRLSEMENDESEVGRNLSHGETAGSAILAKLRNERCAGKERTEGEKDGNEGDKEMVVFEEKKETSMTEKKRSEGEKESDKEEPKGEGMNKGEKEKEEKMEITRQNSASRSRRRNKTVEKPVKSLGIASESERVTPSSDDHTMQLPMVSLRKTPSSVPRLPSTLSSSANTPTWVAVAEKKKQRVSAMLEGSSSSPTPPIISTPDTTPITSLVTTATPTATTTSNTVTVTAMTTSNTVTATTTSNTVTATTTSNTVTATTTSNTVNSLPATPSKQTHQAVITPTKPVFQNTTTTPSFSFIKLTPVSSRSEPVTTSTSPVNKLTVPSPTKHTVPPPTKHTVPSPTSITLPTSPTKTLVTKRTKDFPTTPPPPPTTNGTAPTSQESGIPRKGTVRDRMALFQ